MKTYFYFFLSFISFTYAATPSGCPEIQLPRIPCTPCTKEIIPPPCISGYNTPAGFDVRSCLGINIWGSYLYWMPKLEGIDLGISTTNRPGIDSDLPLEGGKVINFDYKYKSGFRAGVSLLYDFDYWTFEVEYTFFHNSQNQDKEGFLCPKWLSPRIVSMQPDVPTSVCASWKLDYDLFDFHFARNYYVGKKLCLKPHFGGEFLFLKQKLQAEYFFPRFPSISNFRPRTFVSKNNIHANSYGTRAGIESNWIFGQTFRIIGTIAGAILWTDYDVNTSQFNKNFPDLLPTNVKDNDFWCLRPHAETRFGLAYGDYFCCDRIFVDLSVLYEFHVLWNQNVFLLLYEPSCPKVLQLGDLYLHGLTATLKMSF